MSIPFNLVTSMPSGGAVQNGAIAAKAAAGAGTGDAGGSTAFAGTLVQALLGQNGTGAQAQSNMMASDLLAGLAAVQAAEGETSLPGDLLLQWLGTMDMDTALEGQEELLAGLLALMELAQAVIQQWKPSEDVQQTNVLPDDLVQPGDSLTGQNGKAKSWIHTFETLVELMKQNPDQPEIAHVVQAFERLLAPVVQAANGQDLMKAGDTPSSAQQSTVVASSAGNVQTVVQSAIAQHSRSRQTETANDGAGVKLAAAANLLVRGAEVRSRLEEIAARAGVQNQLSAIVSGKELASDPMTAETRTPEEGIDNGSPVQQMNHLVRQPAGHQQPAQQSQPVVHADRFADEMAQVLRSMKVSGTNGLSEVRLTLMPEHLGQVDVKVTMQNGHIVAQFMADTAHGKELLESQLSQLRTLLITQGLQVERLEVAQTNPQYPGLFQDSRGQQQSQQSDRRGKEKPDDFEQEPVDFLTELEGVTERKSQSADGSFDVTA